MSSIITNPRVGMNMSDLEARARAGDPWAQNMLTRQSMGFAMAIQEDAIAGADMQDREDILKIND